MAEKRKYYPCGVCEISFDFCRCEKVTITKKQYEALERDSFKLQCLEGAGVDNWEGYDFAMKEFHNGQV